MKSFRLLLLLSFIKIYSFNSAIAQSRWVEEWIGMNGEPRLSQVWLEDTLKNKIEERTLGFASSNKEDWMRLVRSTYDSTRIMKIEIYGKQFAKGKKPGMIMEYEYDQNLRQTGVSAFQIKEDGTRELSMYVTFIYDTNSNMIRETKKVLVDYLGKPTNPDVSTVEYRYKDKLLMEEWKNGNNMYVPRSEYYTYKYDTAGNMIEKKLMDKVQGLEKNLFTYKYDGEKKMIEDYTFFNNGDLFRKHRYIYNENGDLAELLEYGDNSDKPLITVTYKYLAVKK